MTSVEIIGEEITRLVNQLVGIDPIADTDRYHKIVECANNLMTLGYQIDMHNARIKSIPTEPIRVQSVGMPEPSAEEYAAPVMEQPEEVPETTAPVKEEPVKVSRETVRAALAKARSQKGVDINSIILDLGYDSFSAVPAAKYGELMSKLEEAQK